jgi:hypothetical protein
VLYALIYTGIEASALPEPTRPVGWDCINTYRSSVKAIWEAQVATHSNSLSWDLIYNKDCKLLAKMVKERKGRLKKSQYGEKVDKEFAPYAAVEELGSIEGCLWSRGQGNIVRTALAWMRHRYCFLQSFSGILRCESIFNAELSDMLCISTKKPVDPHSLFIVIMQLASGMLISHLYTFS